MKRILTYILAIIILFSGLTVLAVSSQYSEYLDETESSYIFTEEFVDAANNIILEHRRGNYFSHITMTIGEYNMNIDGREIEIGMAAEFIGDELILPIVDIAEAIGEEAVLDARGRTYGANMALREDVEQAFNLDIQQVDDMVIITRPYQTRQLLVRTYNGYRLTETFGAIAAADNGHGFYFLQYETEQDAKTASQLLNANPNVRFSEPNQIIVSNPIQTLQYPNPYASNIEIESPLFNEDVDVMFVESNQTANAPRTVLYYPARLSGEPIEMSGRVWGATHIGSDAFIRDFSSHFSNDEILVAVIDTGVDASNPFLHNRIRTDLGRNFIPSYYGTNFDDWYDYDGNDIFDDFIRNPRNHSHGTHVTGIIVDNTPNNVQIIPVRAIGNGATLVTLAAGINWAIQQGARVINISAYTGDHSFLMEDLVNRAASSGITIITSAGNSNRRLDCITEINKNFRNDFLVFHPNVITVANINANDHIGHLPNPILPQTGIIPFGNYGSVIDVSAPGMNIFSTVRMDFTNPSSKSLEELVYYFPNPPTSIPNHGYVLSLFHSQSPVNYRLYGNVARLDGTSMAAPFVTAAVAMLKLIYTDATPEMIRQIIRRTVNVPNGWNRHIHYSRGEVMTFGTGVLNLNRYPRNVKSEITITPPSLSLDRTTFVLNGLNISATGLLQGINVYVEVNRFDSRNDRRYTDRIRIDNLTSSSILPAQLTRTNRLNPGDYIEILIYEYDRFQLRQEIRTQGNEDNFGFMVRHIVQPMIMIL